MRMLTVVMVAGALVGWAAAADKKLELKDLPPAVQKTVQDQAKGADIKGLSKETEKGKTTYEVETMLNGKHRDFVVDAKGVLGSVEEESTMDAVPAAARAAIQKKVGAGKIEMVETVTGGGKTNYEVTFTDKGGKKHEYQVTAAGAEVKE